MSAEWSRRWRGADRRRTAVATKSVRVRSLRVPRYHIELRSTSHVASTVEIDRDGLAGVRVEVAQFVGELLKDHADQIWEDQDWQVEATDEKGLILFTMNIFATGAPATSMMPRRRH
jgi:hypothetical protein